MVLQPRTGPRTRTRTRIDTEHGRDSRRHPVCGLPYPQSWENNVTRPDDGICICATASTCARCCRIPPAFSPARSVMPNLEAAVTTTVAAVRYRERILAALPRSRIRTVDDAYLTITPAPEEIAKAKESRVIHASSTIGGRARPIPIRESRESGIAAGARRDGKAQHAAAGAWRGDR